MYPALMRWVVLLWALIMVPAGVVSAGVVSAAEDEEESSVAVGRQSLMVVPPGCEAPELPEVVFVGTVVQRDFRTVRWEIRQVRAGDPEAFGPGQQVDIRFGLDGQFLEVGEDYLVSTRREPFIGVLVSQVAVTPELFGGADVVGLAPTQVSCPAIVDVARTFNTDGSEISTSLFSTMAAERGKVLGALVLPVLVLLVVVFVMALLKVTLLRTMRELH
jgi:hypothetical protein